MSEKQGESAAVEVSPPKNIHSNPDAMAWAKYFKQVFPQSDIELMHGWFANAMMAMHDHIYQTKLVGDVVKDGEDTLKPSEAVYGFAGWLTGSEERTVMGAPDAAAVARLVDCFCRENKLSVPREGWENNLIHPSGECSGPAV